MNEHVDNIHDNSNHAQKYQEPTLILSYFGSRVLEKLSECEQTIEIHTVHQLIENLYSVLSCLCERLMEDQQTLEKDRKNKERDDLDDEVPLEDDEYYEGHEPSEEPKGSPVSNHQRVT